MGPQARIFTKKFIFYLNVKIPRKPLYLNILLLIYSFNAYFGKSYLMEKPKYSFKGLVKNMIEEDLSLAEEELNKKN